MHWVELCWIELFICCVDPLTTVGLNSMGRTDGLIDWRIVTCVWSTGILVPLYILGLGYSPKYAIALSNITILVRGCMRWVRWSRALPLEYFEHF